MRLAQRRASTLSAGAVGAAVGAVALVAVIVTQSTASGTGVGAGSDSSLGRPAPALRATATDGSTVDLAAYAGRPVLVDFFASWCRECRAQAAQLAGMARAQGSRMALVSVAEDDTARADADFAARYGWRWSVIEDRDFRLAHDFDVPGVPTAVLIDGHGRIADVFRGPLQLQRLNHDLTKVTG